ncbi:glycosyltransferase family 4 protein [Echinicola jeungdonensis]|uniref:Glycosyltransferase family 4 protein n=1 Tax=Echinicola jeungdonensis TaxID=709343 RepID=A0ABV5J4B2_9BACT|nr:glycosyltransferase family 4 protein [Echinicola jeungdonensis]MDN3667866.1 glycosyltransferase family 4 protein [Echinicola jeungdonensis]
MKILFLPKYTRTGASSRLRTYQYIPLWEKAGHQCTVAPFFNDIYLEELYNKRKISKGNVWKCFWRRFGWVLRARQFDLVILEKELFPFFPAWLEKFWAGMGVRYIVDYDDAIFHNYDQHPQARIRKLLGKKIDRVMKNSFMVWAGNSYLARRASVAGAKNIKILPTSVDLNRYDPAHLNGKREIKIGWIGSPTTLRYLKGILPALEQLKEKHGFSLTIIANGEGVGFSGKEEKLVWEEQKEADYLSALDIGIMPLKHSPWEQGKCAYKLIQYMATGLPVVASPIGMNKTVVQPGINGFLAGSKEEWVDALSTLMEDKTLRQKMGKAGRKMVEEDYTLAKNWEKIQGWMVELSGEA